MASKAPHLGASRARGLQVRPIDIEVLAQMFARCRAKKKLKTVQFFWFFFWIFLNSPPARRPEQGILSKDLRGIDWYDNSYLLLDYQRVWLSDVHTKDYYQWFDNQGVWWHHLIITDTYTFDNVNSQKNSFSLTIFTEALLSASPILSPASLTPSTTVRSPVTR